MRNRTIAPLALMFLLATVGVAILAGPATATGPGFVPQIVQALAGTAQFHNVGRAVAAGYAPSDFPGVPGTAECFSNPAGGMGIHYINGGLLTDGVISAAKPEALVYEPQANGTLRLVALEYVIFQADAPSGPPSLVGQTFESNDGVALGIPAIYTLHAWIWKWNPSGLFADWNPRVTCNHAN